MMPTSTCLSLALILATLCNLVNSSTLSSSHRRDVQRQSSNYKRDHRSDRTVNSSLRPANLSTWSDPVDELYWLSYAAMTPSADIGRDVVIGRSRCKVNSDCLPRYNSQCDHKVGLCLCPDGYYPRSGPAKEDVLSQLTAGQEQLFDHFCMRAVSYGEPCVAHDQCVANYSICTEPPSTWSGFGGHGRLCLCKDGFFPGYGPDGRRINDIWFDSHVTCYSLNQSDGLPVNLVIICAIMVTLTLAGLVLYVASNCNRKRTSTCCNELDAMRWTPTVLEQQLPPGGHLDSFVIPEETKDDYVADYMDRDYSRLPPIGSAAAEFQNDFIQIFPMRHLAPQPEKNSHALRAQFDNVSKLCNRGRVSPLYRKIDGALITANNESDLDCVLTFQTDSILQKFMLRFEDLHLDCNDHLYIFDGAQASGQHAADLSCRSTSSEIGPIVTKSNFLTLKYVTDHYSKSGKGFKMAVTAFRDMPSIECRHLKCKNRFCISKDLACDKINHCGDNSDETDHSFCHYHVSKLCNRERFHPLYKKIDGALITAENESDLDCVLTFQTDSILQRFMLRFEELALDCNDHLYIFDGAHAFGHYKADLSCRSTRSEIGTIFTQSNFLTLKYVTDHYSKPGDGFKLVITAFKDTPSIGCSHLKCQNTFCISKDLACDNVNHCGDNTDETSHAFCYSEEADMTLVLGFEANIFIGVVLSVFVICLVCVVNLAVCLCRRESALQQQHRVALHGGISTQTLAHPASYNGNIGPMSPAATRYATLPLPDKLGRTEKPPPYPGNLVAPGGANGLSPLVGHHQMQVMSSGGPTNTGMGHQQQLHHQHGQTVTLLSATDGSVGHLVTGRQDGLTSNGTAVHPTVQQVVYYSAK
ncbi:hypothetical protein HDE_03652 [Halotydeus destructor]|nr:hypothetical protein HDE_03652 [Halotydeus destructor]